jgi:hypothetical protein
MCKKRHAAFFFSSSKGHYDCVIEYRYIVLGRAGSSAALLNGSTYHSVFKIPRETKSKNQDDVE